MHQGYHLNFQGYSHMRNMVMAELRNDLAAWRILLAAVRTGSIRETALQADLPAAKVSRIISELERELGFPLAKVKEALQSELSRSAGGLGDLSSIFGGDR